MLLKKKLTEGFSFLKPRLIQFVNDVHVESEKVSANSEFILAQREFVEFIKVKFTSFSSKPFFQSET